jgi:hypothetical protein
MGGTMLRVETWKMERIFEAENIRFIVHLRFHAMGLVPAYCGEIRDGASLKIQHSLSWKRISAADFVSMQC